MHTWSRWTEAVIPAAHCLCSHLSTVNCMEAPGGLTKNALMYQVLHGASDQCKDGTDSRRRTEHCPLVDALQDHELHPAQEG